MILVLGLRLEKKLTFEFIHTWSVTNVLVSCKNICLNKTVLNFPPFETDSLMNVASILIVVFSYFANSSLTIFIFPPLYYSLIIH